MQSNLLRQQSLSAIGSSTHAIFGCLRSGGDSQSPFDRFHNGDSPISYEREVSSWKPFAEGILPQTNQVYFLDGLFFAFQKMMKRIARTPELIVLDYTFKTNNRDYALSVPVGMDGDNRNATWGLAILSRETKAMTTFLLCDAMPFMYGSVLDRVRIFISDAAVAITDMIAGVLKKEIYGCGFAVHRLCYFHAVNLKFNEIYPQAFRHEDKNTGMTILNWFRHIVWACETKAEVEDSLLKMQLWLEERLEDNVLTQRMFDKIQLFVSHVSTNLPRLSLAYLHSQPIMTLAQKSSSRCVALLG